MSLDDLKDLGSRPVRSDAPTGSPGRDEPEFEQLQMEIRKLELPDGEQPDWQAVRTLAVTLLRDKSKDLLPAAYLAVALLHREGYAGLAAGLGVLRDLAESHWEGLYPEIRRMRGRAAAFEWLGERAGRLIETKWAEFGPLPDLQECRACLDALIESLAPRMDGGIDSLRGLGVVLRETENRVPAPAPAGTPGAGTAVPGGGAATSTSPSSGAGAVPAGDTAPAGPIQAADEAARRLQELREAALRIAEYYRSSEPAEPIGYRLPRSVVWAHLRALPPNVDGRTQIPPPQPADLSARLDEMSGRGQWAGVLEVTESRLAASILWLDLHRHAASALEALGRAAAAQAIVEEVAGLLRRLQGLEALSFANGQPLANETTRAWIRERTRATELPEAGSAPAGSAVVGLRAEEAEDLAGIDEARRQGQELARKKRLREALMLVEAGAGRARTVRGKAQWKLEAARLCMQAGRHETAYVQLQELDAMVAGSTPEDWAPDLCADLVKNLYLCHRETVSFTDPRPPEEVVRSRELWRRLCRLDIVAALALEGPR